MAICHRIAVASDIERLGSLLDAEFIFGKGRTLPLTQRFPSTLCAANAKHIFIAEEDGNIVSAFLAKRFDWRQRDASWRGAMIGAVFCDPQRRGQGIAGKLLQWGVQALRDDGVEFAVLWTGRPDFYARLGWVAVDVGLLGRWVNQTDVLAGLPMPDAVSAMPLALCDTEQIEAVRQQHLDACVVRQALDYRQIPIPAESVEVLCWMQDGKALAYALLGNLGDTGILYEMAGDERGFADLWQTTIQRYTMLMINDCANSPSQQWLARHTAIVWEAKSLAMWLPLSPGQDLAQVSQCYVPYFDRI